MVLARNVNRSSNEASGIEFWFFDRQKIINENQRVKLLNLLTEAKKDEPEQAVVKLLLFDVSMSIVCSQNPSHLDNVDHILMKTASDTYCKLCLINHNGSYKPLRYMTKVHAIMVYCFRAVIIYSIFFSKQGLLDLNEGKESEIIHYMIYFKFVHKNTSERN